MPYQILPEWRHMTPKMPSYFLAAGFSGEVVTANRVIFAVTVMVRTSRRQNAAMVILGWFTWRRFAVTLYCRLSWMTFLPLFSSVISLTPRWRSWRSIPFRRSFSCQKQKRSRYIKTSPSRIFVPPKQVWCTGLVFHKRQKGCAICVIQLAHLHGSIVYHIELMFVNMIFIIATGKEYKS